ncbi:hypothetical protein IPG41_06155 [Candidatus Peregrinibacteria bacterium]|nr:MAG: hypothetical protein IPG41_06155 [Candidatus Peregrinibacteria bacterium]
MIRCHNHYRLTQKNLFLGEEIVLFARTPDDDDDGGTPAGATPIGATAVPKLMRGNENSNIRVPKEARDRAEHKSKLWDEMAHMVPERTEYLPQFTTDGKKVGPGEGNAMEIMEDWLKSLADANEIQSYIGRISKWEEELKNPEKLTDDTAVRFKDRYKEVYSELMSIRKLAPAIQLPGMGIDYKALEAKARAQTEPTTAEILEDLAKFKKALVEQRKVALELLHERAVRDFERRLNYIKKEWGTNPPKGYEIGKDQWIATCNAFLEEARKMPKFDSDNPDFPEGSAVFDRLKRLWGGVNNLELNLASFREGQKEGGALNAQGLKNRLDEIIAKKNKVFNQKTYGEKHDQSFDDWHHGIIKDVLARIDEVIPLYENRVKNEVGNQSAVDEYCHLKNNLEEVSAQAEADPNDEAINTQKKKLQKEVEGFESRHHLNKEKMEVLQHLAGLKSLRGSIEKSGNLGEIFEKAIYNKETYRPVEGNIPYPKGIEAQLDWITKVNVSPEQRNQMFFRFNQVLDTLDKDIEGAENYVQTKLGVNLFKKINTLKYDLEYKPAENKWKIHWMSGFKTYDTVAHTVTSIFERSWKRDDQLKAGMWGKEAFKFLDKVPIPIDSLKPIRELHAEMANEEEHAMMEDISHWSKQYEHASVAHVTHQMHVTKNKFEFRACIEHLCKKGLMRLLDDEAFFKQLNRFQTSVSVPVSKFWHSENRFDSEDVIKKAVFAMYADIDLFDTWHSQNSGAIKSEGGKYNEEFSQIANVPGGVFKLAKKLLDDYKQDIANPAKHGQSDIDPNKYEAALHYAIDNGKMNAEDVLYLLLQGIACGLLSFDRSAIFTGKNNNYPAIEILDDATEDGNAKPTLQNIKEWAKIGEDYDKNYNEYLDWFHSFVMTNEKVVQRVNKAQSQGMRFDHDYFTGFAGHLNSSTIESMLQMKGDGGMGLQVTAMQNGAVGMLFSLDSLAESYGDLGSRGGAILSQMVDSIIRFDAILNARMYANQSQYYKIDNATLNGNPRYAGAYKIYGRGPMSTADHLDIMRKYFAKLDVDPAGTNLLGKLFSNQLKTEADIQAVMVPLFRNHKNAFGKEKTAKDFKTVEDIYRNLGAYIDYAIQQDYPLRNFLGAIKEDHRRAKEDGTGKDIGKIRAHAKEQRMAFKQEFAAQMQRNEMEEPDHHAHHGHGHGDDHGHDEHGEAPHGAHPPAAHRSTDPIPPVSASRDFGTGAGGFFNRLYEEQFPN